MIAEEPEIQSSLSEVENDKPLFIVNNEEKNVKKPPAHFTLNESLSYLSNKKEEKPRTEEDIASTTVETENLQVAAYEEDMLVDNVAINFEPPERYFVETEVNFMTANMSLSMRRTVRTRLAAQQRPPIDPETALALITKPCINYKSKAREVLKFIKKEPETADLKISLYIVACESRSVLKPYPTSVVEETEIGQESLSLVNEEIPSIKLLKYILSDLSQVKTSTPVIAILHWLLIHLQEPKLKLLPSNTFHSIFQKVERAVNFQQPTYVFKLMISRSSPTETTWQARKANRKSSFAFYTDSLEKMHSIIHIGFYPTLLKYKGKIGPGVFFYSDLKHCLNNAGTSSGWGWGKSELGVEMKVVLVAEFLEDPKVKCFDEYKEAFSSDQKALTNGSDGEDELLCYYVSRIDEIRIRYVLIYVQSVARNLPSIVPVRQKTLFSWIGQHKTPLFIVGTLFLTLASKHYMSVLSTIHGFKSMMVRSVFYNMKVNN